MCHLFLKRKKNFCLKLQTSNVLPTVSRIFEGIMQTQISNYIGKFLSPFLCGYIKGFSTQNALLTLIERWEFCLDKQGFASALLTIYLKPFTQ